MRKGTNTYLMKLKNHQESNQVLPNQSNESEESKKKKINKKDLFHLSEESGVSIKKDLSHQSLKSDESHKDLGRGFRSIYSQTEELKL